MISALFFGFFSSVFFVLAIPFGRTMGEFDINWFALVGWIFALIFLIMLITIPIERASTKAWILELIALGETLDRARKSKNISDLELAAIQKRVAKKNENLASAQFWAKHPLTNWFYHPGILDLKPIK